METIIRTETARAHNMGHLTFNKKIEIKKVRWLCVADERSCSQCKQLDGKTFSIDKMPSQPAHHNCSCTHVVDYEELANIRMQK